MNTKLDEKRDNNKIIDRLHPINFIDIFANNTTEDILQSLKLSGKTEIKYNLTQLELQIKRDLEIIYSQTKRENFVRDFILILSSQFATYRASPWGCEMLGSTIHLGALDLSAIMAVSWNQIRLPTIQAPFDFPITTEEFQTYQEAFLALYASEGAKSTYGKTDVTSAPFQDFLAYLKSVPLRTLGLLHICEPANPDNVIFAISEMWPMMVSGGIICVSGERGKIKGIFETLSRHINPDQIRYIDTTSINAEGTSRADGLIVISQSIDSDNLPAFGIPLAIRRQPIVFGKNFTDLKELGTVANFESLGDGQIWSLEMNGAPMSEANCFACDGFENPGKFELDPMARETLGLDKGRFRKAFGRIARLDHARLIDGWALAKDGRAVSNIGFPTPPPEDHWIWQGRVPDFTEERLTGDWVFLTLGPVWALSHWLIENFLPVLTIGQQGFPHRLCVFGTPKPYQLEYLKLAGYGDDKIKMLSDDRIYKVERLYLPLREQLENINYSFTRVHHPAQRQAIQNLLDKAQVKRVRRDRIFVSRSDARGSRSCVNEQAVIEAVERRGYRVVNASMLTPLETLDVYANAGVIAGPLGAGLCNCVFAPPGCQLVSFQARSYFEEHVEQLAHLMGHDFAYLGCDHFGSEDIGEGGCRNSNFAVNIDKLMSMLDLAEDRSRLHSP